MATADTVAINKGTFWIFLPSLRKGELPIETSVQPWYIPHSIPATSSQNDSAVFKNSFFLQSKVLGGEMPHCILWVYLKLKNHSTGWLNNLDW